MKYKYVLFDLDGTVVDSSEGITTSVAYALDKKGIPYEDKASLKHFIGPPLREQFMKCYNLSLEEGEEMVRLYREFYSVTGIYMNSVYEGIKQLLIHLRDSGSKVVLATSKPEKFAKIILEHLSLSDYFDFVAGANMDNTRTSKAEVIEYALNSTDAWNHRDSAVMIGDHSADILGARKCGVDSIFVTYGFGEISEDERLVPVSVVDSVCELEKFLLN